MSLLKIKPFSIDQVETFTFANANVAGNIVAGNANLGNLVTANNFSGNGAGLSSIAGANVTGQVANATVAGTVYTAAQPNITSVGTLTSLTVSGVTDLGAVANVRISGGSANYVLKTDGQGNLSWASATSGTGNANVAGSNTQIQYNDGTNLGASANLTFNVSTKTLTVDNIVANGSGLTSLTGANVTGQVGNALIAGTVYTAAQPNITSVGNLTSLTIDGTLTGNNANFSGNVSVGSGSGGNISGANVISANLFTGTLTTAAQPNITSVGTLTSLVVGNATSNTTLNGNGVITSNGNITVNSGFYFIGNGSQLTGITAVSAASVANGNSNVNIPAANGNVTVSVAGNANIVTVTGTGVNVAGTLNATGNANVGNIGATNGVFTNVSGNGSALSSITGANVTGEVSFAAVANSVAGANVSGQVGNALVAGTVYTAAQPNITSVGNLTSLNVTGALQAGDTTIAGNLTVTGTTTTVNSNVTSIVDPIIDLGGGPNGAPLTTNDGKERGLVLHTYDGAEIDRFIGWMNANSEFALVSNANIANNSVTVNELGSLRAGNAVFGNTVTANYFIGNGSQLTGITAVSAASVANGTSNVNIPTANGNVLISAAGNANIVVVTGTGVNVAGTLNATGNLIAPNMYANSGTIGASLLTGTLTTAAQPNITSVGTLTGLISTGNVDLSGSGNVTLGAIANIHISGGSANYFLKTDGNGTLSWSSLPSTTLSVDTFTGDGSWTMKTLSVEPLNVNYTLVAIGGVFQPRDAYSVTGSVITFDDPPPNGSVVEITTINGGTAGASGYVYQGVNSNTSAITGVRYLVDTSSTGVTVTLPSSAVLGDEIGVTDASGNAAINNINISPNGGKINGSTSNLTLDINTASVLLTYYNSTRGWVIVSKL